MLISRKGGVCYEAEEAERVYKKVLDGAGRGPRQEVCLSRKTSAQIFHSHSKPLTMAR